MAICSVCGASCRGRCAKCGAALCAAHKPASSRAKCAICKELRTGVVRAVQAIPAYPTAPARQTGYALAGAQQNAVPLAALTLTEQLAWIAERRAQLQKKQQRERAYLDRRASRGTHTPTDDAYEADQTLENELFEALDLLESCLQGESARGRTYAGGTSDTSMLFPDPGLLHGKLQP